MRVKIWVEGGRIQHIWSDGSPEIEILDFDQDQMSTTRKEAIFNKAFNEANLIYTCDGIPA